MENLCYFVCSRGLAKSCNLRAPILESSSVSHRMYLNEPIAQGDSIYVCSELLKYFVQAVMPKMKRGFVLVSGDSDMTVPFEILSQDEYNSLVENPLLIRWYAQNTRVQFCEKIVQMPIGLDYHTISRNPLHEWRTDGEGFLPRDQERILHDIRATMRPFWERPAKIYVNFSLNTCRFGQRKACLAQIPETLLEKNLAFTKRTANWKRISECAFVLSPFGNGMDCHRTWEALCLGAIPILCAPSFTKMFEGLPVLIVDTWTEITQELLDKTIAEFRLKNFQYEKLTLAYWQERIKNGD